MSDSPVLPVNEAGLQSSFERAALAAGAAILGHFRGECVVDRKADQSPVTLADREAEALICAILESDFPEIPVIAEERCELSEPPEAGSAFFLVDPLDGTREFIEKSTEFTVNIALIVDGYPVAGIVYAPALNVLYFGGSSGALKKQVAVLPDGSQQTGSPEFIRTAAPTGVVKALVSRNHFSAATEQFLQTAGIEVRVPIGSSLKFCLLAEGKAHIYPRFSQTMQWDTAAGDAVLRAAGGKTLRADRATPLVYRAPAGRKDLINPSFISTDGHEKD